MPYLYHMKPQPMRGDTLYPLNELKHLEPELYRRQLAKYDGHPSRKTLPNRVVPKLDCLIYQAWLELGKTLNEVTFYRVPIERVSAHPAVIYTPPKEEQPDTSLPESCVAWLDTTTFTELKALPSATVEWYAKLHRRGQVGAFFVGIPHVLVEGPVSVSDKDTMGWC